MRLSENHGWLLLSIARGRGHPIEIPRKSHRAGELLEEMEEAGYVHVRSDKHSFYAAILRPGKEALAVWKENEVAEAEARISARKEHA